MTTVDDRNTALTSAGTAPLLTGPGSRPVIPGSRKPQRSAEDAYSRSERLQADTDIAAGR